jgi:hypothetical protein
MVDNEFSVHLRREGRRKDPLPKFQWTVDASIHIQQAHASAGGNQHFSIRSNRDFPQLHEQETRRVKSRIETPSPFKRKKPSPELENGPEVVATNSLPSG